MGLSGSTGCAKNEPLPSQFVPSMVTKQSYFRSECNARAIVVFIIIIIIILFARKIQICFTHDSTRAGQTRLLSSYSCPRKKRQQKKKTVEHGSHYSRAESCCQHSYFIIISTPSPLTPLFQAQNLTFLQKNPSHRSLPFLFRTDHMDSQGCLLYFWAYPLLLFGFFMFYTFQLSHVKIASRIVSYLHAEVNDIKIAIVTP